MDIYEKAVEVHRKYGGKIEIKLRAPVKSFSDFSLYYTPGVAEVARRIAKNPEESFELTWRWNAVAVVSDGTRVLGLGNIGPEGALPVMEGKALLFKHLGGVDAVPLVHRFSELESFLSFLKAIEPSFGGINLEDIESPKCFELLERARKELSIPVWHDDQQGTATAALAGAINALELAGKSLKSAKIVLFGAGAANIALFRLLKAYGVKPGNIAVIDSKGPLNRGREELKEKNRWKWEIAREAMQVESTEEAFEGADIVIAASRPGPGTIKGELIEKMSDRPVVFALANPVPEILPEEAKKHGAFIVATGRSDFPNQVNNSLVFPAVFRGVLDVRAKEITDSMAIAAAEELARFAREKGISPSYIIPRMDEKEVYIRVAARVGEEAVKEGVARLRLSYEELVEKARRMIGKTL